MMKRIGGNTRATVCIRQTETNAIGEQVKTWKPVLNLVGWLDLLSGDTRYSTFHAKIQESTHVFLCDWCDLPNSVTSETARMHIGEKAYDVTMIDDPVGLHEHLEIFLKFVGGQNGC